VAALEPVPGLAPEPGLAPVPGLVLGPGPVSEQRSQRQTVWLSLLPD